MRDKYGLLFVCILLSAALVFMAACDEDDEEDTLVRNWPVGDDDDDNVPIVNDDADDDTGTDDDTGIDDDTGTDDDTGIDDDTGTDDDTTPDDDVDDDVNDDLNDDADDDVDDDDTTEPTTTTTVETTTTTTTTTISDALNIEMIDETTEEHGVGGFVSYLIDDTGTGHVSYLGGDGESPQDVNIYYRNDGAKGWSEAEFVAFTGFDTDYPTLENNIYKISMDIDNNRHIHIAYFDMSTMKLGYAANVTGSWTAFPPNVPENVGLFPTLRLGSDGKARISSMKHDENGNPDTGVYYTTFDGSSWETEQTWETPYNQPDMAITAGNSPRMAMTGMNIAYGTYSNNAWEVSEEFIGDFSYPGTIALTLDDSDAAHVVFHAVYSLTPGVFYASNAGGAWNSQIVSDDARLDHRLTDDDYTDIVVASDDSVHIVYFDASHPELIYATNKSGAWLSTVIDDRDDIWDCGMYPSMAIDSNDLIHVLYICKGLKEAVFPQGYDGQ